MHDKTVGFELLIGANFWWDNILSKLRHTPTSYQVSFFMIMDNGMDAEVRYNISHLILILN